MRVRCKIILKENRTFDKNELAFGWKTTNLITYELWSVQWFEWCCNLVFEDNFSRRLLIEVMNTCCSPFLVYVNSFVNGTFHPFPKSCLFVSIIISFLHNAERLKEMCWINWYGTIITTKSIVCHKEADSYINSETI